MGLAAGLYSAKGDPFTAEGQARYMKDRFPYYGLKAPQWMAIIKELFKELTDWDLMQNMILRRANSDEFFVQKAVGWH